MRDFKEYFQILWKKNSIWLGILAILAILFQGLSMNYTIKDKTFNFYSSVRVIEIIHDNLDKDNSIINKKLDKHWQTHWTNKDKIVESYEDKENGEEILNKAKNQFNEILEKRNYSLEDLKKYNEGASEYEYEYVKDVQIIQELYNFYHSYIEDNQNNNYNFASLDLSKDVFFDGSMIFIVVILGFLFMSMEHLTPYYEFSRMYPWSHGKTYFMKVIFGGLYILLLYIISILMKMAIFKGAQLSDLFSFNIFGPSGIIHLSSIFGLYLIIMASGAISGNVLGHIGMIIISLAGIDLIRGNLIQIFETLKINTNDSWLFILDKKLSKLPGLLQVILRPHLGLNIYSSYIKDYKLWYIGVVGLIFFLVGYYWTLNAKAERSGMLILTKSVSKFAQFFAVLTTASLIHSLFLSMMVDTNSILINLAIYIILLAISYKFYKVIFKIRIGL